MSQNVSIKWNVDLCKNVKWNVPTGKIVEISKNVKQAFGSQKKVEISKFLDWNVIKKTARLATELATYLQPACNPDKAKRPRVSILERLPTQKGIRMKQKKTRRCHIKTTYQET